SAGLLLLLAGVVDRDALVPVDPRPFESLDDGAEAGQTRQCSCDGVSAAGGSAGCAQLCPRDLGRSWIWHRRRSAGADRDLQGAGALARPRNSQLSKLNLKL